MTGYLLLILLSLLVLHLILRYNKWARAINKIPGPPSLPLLGNMLQLNVSSEELWLKFHQFSKVYYPIYKVWFLSNAMVVIRHPDDIKSLLLCKKNINKSSFYDTLSLGIGDGLISSDGEKWHKRRRIVSPAFSPTLLQNHLKISNEYVQNLIIHIKSQGDESIHNVTPLCAKLVLEIMCESAMGVDISKTECEGGETYRKCIELLCDITLYRVPRPYIRGWIMNWLPLGRKLKRVVAEIITFRNKVIAERKKYLEQTESTINENTINKDETGAGYNGRNSKKPLLDKLLSAEKEGMIDSQGVGEEVDHFIAAGYDTTSLALSYTIMLLAENKEAQDLARAEVYKVYDQSNGKISFSEIAKFEYLDLCFKESLRLFPVIPHIGRCLSEDLQLRDALVPANTEVLMNIFDLHRDPNFWREPEKFNPNRFLPEHVRKRHPFAYLPFSMGLRNCIGQKYGLITVKSVLASILYNFYLEPIDRTSSFRFFPISVTLSPGRPIRVKFIKIINRDL